MSSQCVECTSPDTETYRGEDGHFRKQCNACGHVGGPYVAQQRSQTQEEEEPEVSTLDEWLS